MTTFLLCMEVANDNIIVVAVVPMTTFLLCMEVANDNIIVVAVVADDNISVVYGGC